MSIAAYVAVCWWALVGAQTQRPPTEWVTADYDAPPASLEKLWEAASVVVLARVTESTVRALDGSRHLGPYPIVTHDLQIIEVLKHDGSIGDSGRIQVSQPGGSIQVGARTVTSATDGFPVAKVGEELILFLKSWPAAGGYSVAYGPAGRFTIQADDTVDVHYIVRKYTAFGGRARIPKSELLEKLRELKVGATKRERQ